MQKIWDNRWDKKRSMFTFIGMKNCVQYIISTQYTKKCMTSAIIFCKLTV